MDFNKVKKELEEKGIEKGEQELDKLKARLGGFNSGEVSTASTHPEKQTESQASPPGHDSTQSESPGRTGSHAGNGFRQSGHWRAGYSKG